MLLRLFCWGGGARHSCCRVVAAAGPDLHGDRPDILNSTAELRELWSYACQWNSFVPWALASGRRPTGGGGRADITTYLEKRSVEGARVYNAALEHWKTA